MCHICRQELEVFLLNSKQLIDKDNNTPIINYPSNFDEIANAMTREDLESTAEENGNWSRQLLAHTYDESIEEGRYKNISK